MTPLELETLGAAAVQRLIAAGLCQGRVTFQRDTPTQEGEASTADVFVAEDNGEPAGDPRSGYVHLIHTTKIGIEVRMTGQPGAPLRQALATAAGIVYAALLPTFHDWATGAEGMGGVRHTYVTPADAGDGVARVLILVDVLHRQLWEPPTVGLPDFDTLAVDTGDGVGATIPVP